MMSSGTTKAEAAPRTRVIGRQVARLDSVGSTMDESSKLAERGASEGLVVVAEEQSQGRGRFGRVWMSPRGKDLLFSIILRPAPSHMPYLNMAAALAVSECVEDATGRETTIKWPNDVRLRGRKIAGILVQSVAASTRLDYAVIGVGLNVNSDPASVEELRGIATSMSAETGVEYERDRLLEDILRRMDDRYAAIRGGQTPTREWAAKLDTLGRRARVRWGDSVEEGFAGGVDDRGNLLLTLPNGVTKTISAGEVTLRS